MSVVTVAAMCVPTKRICPRAGRRASKGARRVLSVRAAGENPSSPEEEEDLPKPIKLTPEQAKVWVQTTAYLSGRIQASLRDCPGRNPDMSEAAADAMRAAIAEVEAAARAASA